jgi:hypothetical protein
MENGFLMSVYCLEGSADVTTPIQWCQDPSVLCVIPKVGTDDAVFSKLAQTRLDRRPKSQTDCLP